MIYQTTKGIDPAIRKSGCYFLSVLRIWEILTEHALSVDEVNQIFHISGKVGFIGLDGFMKEGAGKGVSGVASGLTNKHAYLKRVGEKEKHNFLIGKYKHTGIHFILMPGPLNKEYDPWSADGSNTVKKGKFHSSRYYFGEKV